MSARIVQVDLAQPLPTLYAGTRHHSLWILVKFGIQPLGWVKCRARQFGGVIAPDMLSQIICDALWLQINDAARQRTFERSEAARHQPSVSIIVCTREHPDQLQRQLESMAKLEYPDFEVVVVDNAARTDATKNVCAKFDFVRRVLEPRPGLDYARNTGWQVARSEIIAYTDDDAIVDPHWLTALAENFADSKVNCVTGITFPLEMETPAQAHFERYGGMQRGFHRRCYRPGTWNAYFPLGAGRFGAGVNMSLRRKTLEAMGGFDPALDTGSLTRGGGDLDIFARVLRDGGSLVYDPRAICFHQHRRTMSQLRRQMYDYGHGFAAYCAKHARDLELGNLCMSMAWHWTQWWGVKRFKDNLRNKLSGRAHFPLHLIVLEAMGAFAGIRAYKRSVRKVRSDGQRFLQKGIVRPMKAAA